MAGDKQAWRLTGLWSKTLPSGGKVLSAKVPVQMLLDTLQQVRDAGLHEVEVEVWESRYAEDRKPTHNLRLAEPFKPQGQQPAKPTWGSHQQDSPPSMDDAFPF
ncbi:MAG: hypothetical protein EBX40_00070 [Gammaproteobacteria bacterium]|nr:hypothetical protein [Gammaproteobacteria bacterium]